jgi:hypothetical protein
VIGTIKWKENDREGTPISSADDLLSALRAIASQTTQQSGIAAVLNKPSKQELIVIMAGPRWALDWFPENYKGVGSYHTVAETFDPETDELPEDLEVATYYIFGHHSEIPLEYTISEGDALRGVREFFETTAKPPSLRWGLD